MARLAAQEQKALGAGLKVVAGELREIDTCAGTGGEVEKATAVALGAVGQHDPAARAEAAVQAASRAWIIGAVPPLLARSTEADVLGHVVEEKPTSDIVKEHRRQVRSISPFLVVAAFTQRMISATISQGTSKVTMVSLAHAT